MPVDIRPDHLAIIQNILKLYVPEYRVMAFGSRVTGAAKKTSDLDLCIMADDHVSFATLGALRDEFSLSNLPYKVDVIDWTTTAPDFRKIILEKCVEIQSANANNLKT
jgi:predicted nucleotidyltransferase